MTTIAGAGIANIPFLTLARMLPEGCKICGPRVISYLSKADAIEIAHECRKYGDVEIFHNGR
jgi:hypothetical protein